MQQKIHDIIFKEDDITWQSMMMDIVKSEDMDPWDIDIRLLSTKFLNNLRQMKELDFRVSGKVILAASILLRLKSYRFLDTDIMELDRIIAGEEMSKEEFYDGLEEGYYDPERKLSKEEQYRLIPRTPQPRKRKVSIYDLVGALNKALEVKQRRVMRSMPGMKALPPAKKVDMSMVIKGLYLKILDMFKNEKKLTFSQLIPSDDKEDKVMTFIPLLHLTNQQKVDINQEKHFGEIYIYLKSLKARNKEEVDRETSS